MNFGLFFLLHQSSIKSEHLIWYLILLFSHSLFVNPIVDPAFCTKHHVYTFSQKKSHLKLSISVAPRSSITHLQIFSLIDHIWISTMLPLLKASFLSSDCLASLCLYLHEISVFDRHLLPIMWLSLLLFHVTISKFCYRNLTQ